MWLPVRDTTLAEFLALSLPTAMMPTTEKVIAANPVSSENLEINT
jgi:hypothetical protein